MEHMNEWGSDMAVDLSIIGRPPPPVREKKIIFHILRLAKRTHRTDPTKTPQPNTDTTTLYILSTLVT